MTCAIFNYNSPQRSLFANDSYSIITFVDYNLSIDYAFLYTTGAYPLSVDPYIDLIYLYLSSALITITQLTSHQRSEYSTNLHTHYRPNPPQNVWIKFDPGYKEVYNLKQ